MQRKFSGAKKNKNRNRKKYRGGFFEVVENRFFDSDICELQNQHKLSERNETHRFGLGLQREKKKG